MECHGVHFALTKNHEKQLLSRVGDDRAVLKIFQDVIEERRDGAWLEEREWTWSEMH